MRSLECIRIFPYPADWSSEDFRLVLELDCGWPQVASVRRRESFLRKIGWEAGGMIDV